MARKKRSPQRRTRTRTVFKTVKRAAKSPLGSLFGQFVAAFGYGALRPTIGSFVTPVTNRFLGGLGENSDEAGLALFNFAMAGMTKGIVKKGFKAGMLIEGASLGQGVLGKKISGSLSGSPSQGERSPGLLF